MDFSCTPCQRRHVARAIGMRAGAAGGAAADPCVWDLHKIRGLHMHARRDAHVRTSVRSRSRSVSPYRSIVISYALRVPVCLCTLGPPGHAETRPTWAETRPGRAETTPGCTLGIVPPHCPSGPAGYTAITGRGATGRRQWRAQKAHPSAAASARTTRRRRPSAPTGSAANT